MRGGYRTGAGRPSDPWALRRDRPGDHLAGDWVLLPPKRTVKAPRWPLPEPTPVEQAMWTDLWTRPQASEWERCWLQDEVALYVRTYCRAIRPTATAALLTLVRQQGDSLGLTLAGLRARRWLIEQPEPEAPKEKRPYQRSRFAQLLGGAPEESQPERVGSRFDRLITSTGTTDGGDAS